MKASGPTWPATIFFLRKAPRTVAELCDLTGAHENTVLHTLHLLQGEGLIEAGKLREKDPPNKRGKWPQEWNWT